MSKHIKRLIAEGEHQHLDFKFEISDAKKIARTFSAFANTEGGTLLVGVKDNGVIAGIRTDEEAYMIESAADLYCKPRVGYNLKTWNIDGKTILEVIIPQSELRPHLAPWKTDNWKAYIRVKDENFLANSIQFEVWKKYRMNKGALIKYNESEEKLLGYLRNHQEITLKEFCKLCKIKYPTARKILVNLVAIGVIIINFKKDMAAGYRLRSEF